MYNDTKYNAEVEAAKEKKCQCGKNLLTCECKSKDEAFFDAWTKSLEEMEQPKACSVNNPDCENCGS
jgi:hypothetical protein|tara:strand:+ start:129 stop:329 length:201 start_codon:yes stop_codon:yes gene_type:complete